MRSRLLFLFLACTMGVFHARGSAAQRGVDLGWGPTVAAGLNLYVATTGNDSNSGSLAAPLRTIYRARDYLRARSSMPTGGITVWIRGGRYQLDTTLAFTSVDSGLVDRPIIYRAYANEEVTLAKGVVVDPARWMPMNPAAQTRVCPKVNPDSILELDAAALGIRRLGPFPASFSSTWNIGDLICDNRRQPVAQWPNPEENIRGVNEPGWTTCNGSRDVQSFYYGAGGAPTDKDTTNELDLDGTNRSLRWSTSMASGHGLWLKGFWRVPWTPVTVNVAEINLPGHWIKLAANTYGGMGSKYTSNADSAGTYRVGDGHEKWSAINYLDEIDQPGEWALDFKDKKIYFWPPKDLHGVQTYLADDSGPVISLTGTANIRFIALTIEGSQGNGIALTNASRIVIGSCAIRNVGNLGISDVGGSNNLYQGNDIYETGSSGISLQNAGSRLKLTSSNTSITNNHVHHTGRLSCTYAISINQSVGVYCKNNLIHNVPQGGFTTNLINDCVFEYNEIHNISLSTSDMGGYYGYGGWTCYGNEIRYNFLHHMNRSNGLYSDDGTSGHNFHHNIIQSALRPFLIGGGHHNIGRNCLIVNCSSAGSIDDRGITRFYFVSSGYGDRVREVLPLQEPWKSYAARLISTYAYPSTDALWGCTLDSLWHPEYPNGSMLIDNVEVPPKGFSKPAHGTVTVANNVSLADTSSAGFFNYANMDLRTNNAVVLGKFPDLNTVFPLMGLRTDDYRIRVPTRAETGGLTNRGAGGDPWYEDPVSRVKTQPLSTSRALVDIRVIGPRSVVFDVRSLGHHLIRVFSPTGVLVREFRGDRACTHQWAPPHPGFYISTIDVKGVQRAAKTLLVQ